MKIEEFHPKNVVQTQIDLVIDEVNEYIEDKTKHFDKWVEFGTVTLAKKLIKKQVLEKFISLDKAVIKGVETLTIAHAMEHMV